MQEIVIRDLNPDDDIPFVLDSWLKSYYGQSGFSQYVSKSLFTRKHAELIKTLLSKSQTKLAVKSDDPNIIVGYICFEKLKETLHYVYVKESFRSFGICRHLLKEYGFFDGTIISHLTLKGRKIQLRMGYIYSPYFD